MNKPMPPRSFVCDGCGHEFTTDSTLSEMQEEFKKNYGVSCEECGEEIVSVCDSCFEQIRSFE